MVVDRGSGANMAVRCSLFPRQRNKHTLHVRLGATRTQSTRWTRHHGRCSSAATKKPLPYLLPACQQAALPRTASRAPNHIALSAPVHGLSSDKDATTKTHDNHDGEAWSLSFRHPFCISGGPLRSIERISFFTCDLPLRRVCGYKPNVCRRGRRLGWRLPFVDVCSRVARIPVCLVQTKKGRGRESRSRSCVGEIFCQTRTVSSP